ncbi:hypothetical protein [Spiroplasma endosymbiont of Panorpa germanica]|uniref:hypothetical protein n=1 Tax=Spiroplasma endosymbiont of Panorpa germanica TaxID=3066314 RepID=UPI0030D45E74
MNFLDFHHDIVNKFMQKNIKINYNKFQMRWPYEDYFNIFNLPNLVTYLEKDLNCKFGNVFIDEIEVKLVDLRALNQNYYQIGVKMINEMTLFDDQLNYYKDFLIYTYSQIKNFINLTFLKWIFHNINHENIIISGREVDIDVYYEVGRLKLENNYILHVIKIIKKLQKIQPEEAEFGNLIEVQKKAILKIQDKIKAIK